MKWVWCFGLFVTSSLWVVHCTGPVPQASEPLREVFEPSTRARERALLSDGEPAIREMDGGEMGLAEYTPNPDDITRAHPLKQAAPSRCDTGEQCHCKKVTHTPFGFEGGFATFVVSAPQKLVIVVSKSGSISFWEHENQRMLSRFAPPSELRLQGPTIFASLHPAGSLLALVGQRSDLQLWSVVRSGSHVSMTLVQRIPLATNVHRLLFSRDGGILTLLTHEHQLRVWSLTPKDAKPLQVWKLPANEFSPIVQVRSHGGSGRVITTHLKGRVVIWKAPATPTAEASIEATHQRKIGRMADITKDGAMLLAGNGQTTWYRLPSFAVVHKQKWDEAYTHASGLHVDDAHLIVSKCPGISNCRTSFVPLDASGLPKPDVGAINVANASIFHKDRLWGVREGGIVSWALTERGVTGPTQRLDRSISFARYDTNKNAVLLHSGALTCVGWVSIDALRTNRLWPSSMMCPGTLFSATYGLLQAGRILSVVWYPACGDSCFTNRLSLRTLPTDKQTVRQLFSVEWRLPQIKRIALHPSGHWFVFRRFVERFGHKERVFIGRTKTSSTEGVEIVQTPIETPFWWFLFSPDGKWLLTLKRVRFTFKYEAFVQLWDASTLREHATLTTPIVTLGLSLPQGAEREALAVHTDPKGRWWAMVIDGRVNVFSFPLKGAKKPEIQLLWRLPLPVMEGLLPERFVSFHPTKDLMAVAWNTNGAKETKRNGFFVAIWDLQTGARVSQGKLSERSRRRVRALFWPDPTASDTTVGVLTGSSYEEWRCQ